MVYRHGFPCIQWYEFKSCWCHNSFPDINCKKRRKRPLIIQNIILKLKFVTFGSGIGHCSCTRTLTSTFLPEHLTEMEEPRDETKDSRRIFMDSIFNFEMAQVRHLEALPIGGRGGQWKKLTDNRPWLAGRPHNWLHCFQMNQTHLKAMEHLLPNKLKNEHKLGG